MLLTDTTLRGFIDVLASSSPAPGGGSAAALSGATGAALVAMVCRLTIGKPSYQEHEELMNDCLQRVDKVQSELFEAIQKDTEAFDAVMAAFSMPKVNDDEKKVRAEAIQEAFKGAVSSPVSIAAMCLRVLEIASMIVEKCNVNAISDIGVGALQALAGLKGAILNIKINIPSIKDTVYVEDKKKWIERITADAERLSADIERAVLAKI